MKKWHGIFGLAAALVVGALAMGQTLPAGERALVDPPGISVSLKDATLEQVAAALSKVTGRLVQKQSTFMDTDRGVKEVDDGVRYTLELKDRPFWEVLRALHQQHPLEVGIRNGMYLAKGGGRSSLESGLLVGGLWFRISGVQRQQVAEYQLPVGKQVQPEGLTVYVEVVADPRITLLTMKPLRLVEVVDENGLKLFVGGKQEHLSALDDMGPGGVGGMAWLRVPEGMGKKMATFKAEADLVVCVGERAVELADVEQGRKSAVMSRQTVAIEPIETGGARTFRLEVEARRAGSRAMEERPWPLSLKLVDSKGGLQWQGVVQVTGTVYARNTDAVAAGGKFEGPMKLIVTEPTGLKEVTVGFEMKDVAVP